MNAIRKLGNEDCDVVESMIDNLKFHDLTSPETFVPDGLHYLLGLNLSFCPTPPAAGKSQLRHALTDLSRQLRLGYYFLGENNEEEISKRLYVPSDWNPPKGPDSLETVLEKIDAAIDSYRPKRKTRNNLSSRTRKLMNQLRKREDLLVTAADKNLGPVLIESEKYRLLCEEHLHSETYEVVNEDMNMIKKKLCKYVTDFRERIGESKTNKIITHDIADKGINQFYALIKIHKKNLSIRPIVSNTMGIMSGLSMFLDDKLQKYTKKLHTFLKDSDDLLLKLQEQEWKPGLKIYTFDVVSMYTNIDIDTAIWWIKGILPPTVENGWLVDGLELVMKNNYFSFNNVIYRQKKGTAMGTSVAPTFAVLFLGAVEEKVRNEFKMTLSCRFIDDGFLIAENDCIQEYLGRMTELSKLEFTWEEHKKEAAFLDLVIFWEKNKFLTKTHEKALNLYLYVTSSSSHPRSTLKSIVNGRIKKFKQQNSLKEHYEEAVRKLFIRLRARGYKEDELKKLFAHARNLTVQKDGPQKGLMKTKKKNAFVKLTYDPRLDRKQLAELYKFDELQSHLAYLGMDSTILCWKRPSNLKGILSPTTRLSNPSYTLDLARRQTDTGTD